MLFVWEDVVIKIKENTPRPLRLVITQLLGCQRGQMNEALTDINEKLCWHCGWPVGLHTQLSWYEEEEEEGGRRGRGAWRTKDTNLKMRQHVSESPMPRQGGFTLENCGLGPLTRARVSFRGDEFIPDWKLVQKRWGAKAKHQIWTREGD